MEFKGFGLQKQDKNVVLNRQRYVGGSDVPTILGINSYKTQFELAKEKTGLEQKEFIKNKYTEFGNYLEPQIREYINTVNASNFIVDTFIDEERRIRSNVDGYDAEEKCILEIKTHGANPKFNVYEAQMQMYMWQTGATHGWLALYRRPDNFDLEFDSALLQIKEVERNEEYIQKILNSIETFWIRCEYLLDAPDMDEEEYMTTGTDMDLALVKLNNLAPTIIQARAQIKEMEQQEKELKDYLYQKMEENDIKKMETPLLAITRVLPSTSKRFDSQTFKKNHADLYEEYTKENQRKGYVKITERAQDES